MIPNDRRVLRRFTSEQEMYENDPYDCFFISQSSTDPYLWNVVLVGPDDSPYEGGKFKVELHAAEYPYLPPTCKFITKIFHPCVQENG